MRLPSTPHHHRLAVPRALVCRYGIARRWSGALLGERKVLVQIGLKIPDNREILAVPELVRERISRLAVLAAQGQTVETPCIVGLRPGYSYRVALSDIAEAPNRVFFPTLEVRASLLVGHRLKSADFPATLHFSGEDFARAEGGALIKKIIVLERPDQAIPHPSKANEPSKN